MKDYLIRATGFNDEIRAFSVVSTSIVSQAQKRHQTSATASAALGRTLSVAAMMGSMYKGNEKITIKIDGDGPIGAIIVDADTEGNVRGYVRHPKADVPRYDNGKLAVGDVIGKGFLTVVKDLGLKENFSGMVPLVSGEIGDDFTYYFATSEQVPSAVGVGVLVNQDDSISAAGGFIVQVLPGASEETITELERRITSMPHVSSLVEQGCTPEALLQVVLGEDNVKMLGKQDIQFQCVCSKDRFATAIIGLGNDEIQAMIEEDGQAETVCQFCGEKYIFTKEELEKLKAND
ncbi:Hsp33 family molecular chaperone HslO [Massilibacterium senegalense]|uniref:Hsp33 family molecular chaperone HslO n=1 Tax=Massilibacterium senegalense TaxID=1632858 RepID=UPI0007868149|nr:Hsp33 family molecular chaperone HslO [Massilibacterium senegalense]